MPWCKQGNEFPSESEGTGCGLIICCSILCVFGGKFNRLGCCVTYWSAKLEAVPIKISMKAGGAGVRPNILLKTIRFCTNLMLSGFGRGRVCWVTHTF